MIDSVAWGIGITGGTISIALGASSIVKTLYGKRFCEEHVKIMSAFTEEVTNLKTCLMKLVVYVTDKSSQEGRDLNKELIEELMKSQRRDAA